MIAQKPKTSALEQLAEEMLERRRALYAGWANEFGFDQPPEKSDQETLKAYAEKYKEELYEADILSEIRKISSGELFLQPPRDRTGYPSPVFLRDVKNPKPCLAIQAEEMLERRRAFLTEWSREFCFEAPPRTGEWEELKQYEERNSSEIERADLMSEVQRILSADV